MRFNPKIVEINEELGSPWPVRALLLLLLVFFSSSLLNNYSEFIGNGIIVLTSGLILISFLSKNIFFKNLSLTVTVNFTVSYLFFSHVTEDFSSVTPLHVILVVVIMYLLGIFTSILLILFCNLVVLPKEKVSRFKIINLILGNFAIFYGILLVPALASRLLYQNTLPCNPNRSVCYLVGEYIGNIEYSFAYFMILGLIGSISSLFSLIIASHIMKLCTKKDEFR